MNTQTATSPPEPWSWADQVSTYRFWGLFAFYLMSVAAAGSLFGFGIFWVIYGTTSSATALGAAGFVMRFAKILGFLLALAWVLAHVQPKRALFVFASLQLIGAALIAVAAVFGDWLYYLAAFFFGAGLGGVLLGVPAVIAGGRGGVETFVLVIGTIAISETFVASMSILTFSVINSPGVLATATGAVILLGLLFLIPVNRVFFSEPPPSRVRSFPPTRRNPITVGLLSLVPLYNVYHIPRWLYMVHGEAAHLSPSSALLSPKAAAWGAFVPFLPLISIASLIGCLNFRASQLGRGPYRSPLAIFLWTFFLLPVGIALTQSAINRLAEPGRGTPDRIPPVAIRAIPSA